MRDGSFRCPGCGRPGPSGYDPVADARAEVAVRFAGFTLDSAARTLTDSHGREVGLRRSEFALLSAFVAAPGRVLSRDHLLEAVAGRHSESYDRTIDVLVSRLRRKIETEPKQPRLLVTVPGVGYRFVAKPQPVGPEIHVGPVVPLTLTPERPAAPEHRQLTILCCRLGLSGPAMQCTRRDPEELQELMIARHARCREIIRRAGGTVSNQLGETILAHFGYPETYEDAAERATQAALRCIEAEEESETGHPDTRQPRVGIATGSVLVGDLLGGGELALLGDAPDLAAWLSGQAQPGTVLIDGLTRRLVGELFQCREPAPIPLDGLAHPLSAWEVVGAGLENRFEALRGHVNADLVGREEEQFLLLRRWERAKTGAGRVVFITGEAGIGKSRLARAVREGLEGEAVVQLAYFCSPHHRDSPLRPMIAQLEVMAGFARNDTADVKYTKLKSLLARSGSRDEEIALLAGLLSIPAGARYQLPDMDPRKLRERIRDVLLNLFCALAARGPTLVMLEDAHWIDPTTLELLAHVAERVAVMPVLLLITARPEFKPPWPDQAHVSSLLLNRLSDDQAATLAQRVARDRLLTSTTLGQIVRHADGVPLFVEELTKAAVETGAPDRGGTEKLAAIPQPALKVPATLQSSLLARLDRLGPAAKETAQVGAAIGREFSYELLAAVVERSALELQAALGGLTAAGLVFQHGMPPATDYIFKHALVQDAAYGTMLGSQRRSLHARIADRLESQFPEIVAVQPERVAQHCAEAGLVEKAIKYWIIAGQKMVARSAMQEALSQISRGLEMLPRLPDGKSRDEYELSLRVVLGRPLMATRGWAAPVTGENYTRARQLCEELDHAQPLPAILVGQWSYDFGRGAPDLALERADALRQLGAVRKDVVSSMVGRHCAGVASFYMGMFAPARAHLDQSLLLFDPARRRDFHDLTAADPHVMTLLYLSRTLSCLGYFSQARACREAALNEARHLAHSFTLVFALGMACLGACAEGRVDAVLRWADEVAVLAAKDDLPFWQAWAGIHRGWCLSMTSREIEGTARLAEDFATYRSMGGTVHLPLLLTILAEISGRRGQAVEGLRQLAEAGDIIQATQSRAGEADLYRMRGGLLLAMGDPAAAESSYRAALTVARQQTAKLWELRAATGLARLWHDQGKSNEAHALLTRVYGWFTEGFDTPIVAEAKRLLDGLPAL